MAFFSCHSDREFARKQAYTGVVRHILDWQVPLLVLGGGGYHNADSARCYTAIAAEVVGVKLPRDIPEHDYLSHYGMRNIILHCIQTNR